MSISTRDGLSSGFCVEEAGTGLLEWLSTSKRVVEVELLWPSGGVSVEEDEAEAVEWWSTSTRVVEIDEPGLSGSLLDDAGAGGVALVWSRSTRALLDVEEPWSILTPYLVPVKASEK